MTKVDIKRLDSVTSNDTTATALINDNFKALQDAVENTLSRDGSTPNFMDADLDMNSYKIINCGEAVDDNDVVTIKYIKDSIGGATQAAQDAANSAAAATSSAQSALVSAANAAAAVRNAETTITQATQLLDDTKTYVDEAKVEIDGVVAQGKTDIDQYVIDAEDEVKQIARDEANKAIAGAAAEATRIATEDVTQYVDGTVKPSLQTYVDQASISANEAKASTSAAATSATNAKISETSAAASATAAKQSEDNAEIWAEGTDTQVQALGGTKSAKGWAEQIDDNNLVHKTGNETISGTKTFDNNGKLVLEDNAAMNFDLKSTQYDITNKQARQFIGNVFFKDKNNKVVGKVDSYFTSETDQAIRLVLFNKNNQFGVLEVVINDDGVSKVRVPTPPSTANYTEAVTAQWIRSYISSIITPDYSAGIVIPQANAFPYTAPSDGVLLIAASSYNNVRNEFFINGNSVAIAWSAVSGSATTFYQPVYMKKGETVTTTRTQNAPVNNIFYPMKGTV